MHSATLSALMLGWICLAFAMWARPRGPVTAVARRDRGSQLSIFVQAIGMGLVWSIRRPPASPIPGIGILGSPALFTIVAVLAVGSGALAIAAIRTLGSQWSLTAQIREGHTLIMTGPYAYVRHPIYSALLGLLLATGLVFSPWSTIALAAAVFAAGTVWRVRIEERLLRAQGGIEFEKYTTRVPAFVPWKRAG